ncbi:hypothetical protein BDZ89DRAFT_280693 [Hymenopellis radicata]|nr:hypothetical protein BDZ89DRAFT_280693 [Hymenopellis radicata]
MGARWAQDCAGWAPPKTHYRGKSSACRADALSHSTHHDLSCFQSTSTRLRLGLDSFLEQMNKLAVSHQQHEHAHNDRLLAHTTQLIHALPDARPGYYERR